MAGSFLVYFNPSPSAALAIIICLHRAIAVPTRWQVHMHIGTAACSPWK
jgi:hypothetical protein